MSIIATITLISNSSMTHMDSQTQGQGRDYKQTYSEGVVPLVPGKDKEEFRPQQYK